MKFFTVFLQVGNLQCPSVPKPLISVLEKKSIGILMKSIFHTNNK